MITSIKRLVARLRQRRPRRSIELDAVQQLALLFIAQFDTVSEHDVFLEIAVRRPYIDWPETFMALMKLRSSGLIVPGPGNGTGVRRYSATKLGRKLACLIPQEPSSIIEFYV